jgi:CTP:molybdopterin cytidylyltransferase MocA
MVHGIVLAAGASSRMGRPKAGLRLGPGGPTFLQAVVDTLRAAGVPLVAVVAGAHPEAVRDAVAPSPGLTVVEHPGWQSGQLSSLLAGLDRVDAPDLDAVVMTLVDVPLVRAHTVRVLIDRWQATRAPIVRPAIGERHGHPVIFDRATFAALRAAPVDIGAKAVVREFAAALIDVATDDPGVLRDFDTPEDYGALAD